MMARDPKNNKEEADYFQTLKWIEDQVKGAKAFGKRLSISMEDYYDSEVRAIAIGLKEIRRLKIENVKT